MKVSHFYCNHYFISCCLLLEPRRRRQRARPTEQAVEPQQEPQQLDEGKSFLLQSLFHLFLSFVVQPTEQAIVQKPQQEPQHHEQQQQRRHLRLPQRAVVILEDQQDQLEDEPLNLTVHAR